MTIKNKECPHCDYFEKKYRDVSECVECGLGKTEKKTKEPDEQNYVYNGKKAGERKEELKFYVDRYIPEIPEKRKSLDIGCGNGILPNIMNEKGWDAYGIDPFINKERDKIFCEKIKCKSLQDFETKKKFQLVTLIHTFEHMPNPKKSAEKIAKFMEEGGYIFICVPNFSSYWSKLRGESWRWINTSEHRYHFTPESLQKILSEASYENIEIKTENKNMRGLLKENIRAKGYLRSGSTMDAILHKSVSILDPIMKGIVDNYLDRRQKGAELIAVAQRH